MNMDLETFKPIISGGSIGFGLAALMSLYFVWHRQDVDDYDLRKFKQQVLEEEIFWKNKK